MIMGEFDMNDGPKQILGVGLHFSHTYKYLESFQRYTNARSFWDQKVLPERTPLLPRRHCDLLVFVSHSYPAHESCTVPSPYRMTARDMERLVSPRSEWSGL